MWFGVWLLAACFGYLIVLFGCDSLLFGVGWVCGGYGDLWVGVVCGLLGGLAVGVWFAVFGFVWFCDVFVDCLGGLLVLMCFCVIIQVFVCFGWCVLELFVGVLEVFGCYICHLVVLAVWGLYLVCRLGGLVA